MKIVINGFETSYVDCHDNGDYLLIAIPYGAPYDFGSIAGKFIAGHLITQTDIRFSGNQATHVLAYY